MSEPLWDDKRIDAEIESIEEVWIEESFAAVARHIRDDYERRIAELEAQLAEEGEWVLVQYEIVDGEIGLVHEAISVQANSITFTDDVLGEVTLRLPEHLGIYRRTSSDA